MEPILIPHNIEGKRVLLAVSGGIAAYKSAELCRLLVKAGATVQVMMTAAARNFVGEVTFAALSDHPVATELFDPVQEAQIGHIRLADESDLMIVAPATANVMAKMAHGVADDLVTTVYLAFTAPVLLAPAMNINMWQHPATRSNVEALVQRGHRLVGPESGELACGHVGAGRMSEPEQIVQAAGWSLVEHDLEGREVLVTAGPTHEPLDPVRFVGNRSSGRMGYALAAEAAARGAKVVLISGPSALETPLGVQRVDVVTAAQMLEAVSVRASKQDAIIMAAAVADFRPVDISETKLKKEQLGDRVSLDLERTTDILARLEHPLLVGFAAETAANLERVARAKLSAKGCQLLVANNVLDEDAGFEVETNRVILLDADGGSESLPLMSKRAVAGRILDRVTAALGSTASGRPAT